LGNVGSGGSGGSGGRGGTGGVGGTSLTGGFGASRFISKTLVYKNFFARFIL
jgi:hypothetical protein